MARKTRDNRDGEKKSGGSVIAVIIVILVVLTWLAIFIFMVKLDVFGLGTMLRPALKDIPVINMILPDMSDEDKSWNDKYPYSSAAEYVARIQELEAELRDANADNSYLDRQVEGLEAEVARLKVFEDDVLAFEERVRNFNYMVVFNPKAPDIDEYRQFYEEINPETAAEIYELVIQRSMYDEGIKEQAAILVAMKPGQAAAALEESTADIELICNWLLCMDTDESAAIMNKMDSLFVAKILRKMADMNEADLADILEQMSYETVE